MILYIPGQNEPESIGIAAGAYLGGKSPLIYMQNSGLLKSINEIGSLLLPYHLPVLFIVAYRGCEGEDAPQHFITGGITNHTLKGLDIFHTELEEDNIEQVVADTYKFMREKNKPAVILIKRGWSSHNPHESRSEDQKNNAFLEQIEKQENNSYDFQSIALNMCSRMINRSNYTNHKLMKREEAIDAVMDAITPQHAVFSTTGLISRSIYERYDAPNQFYNPGAFGMVSSIGLGFACARIDKRSVVVDGDSSLLTNFGTLVTIGNYQPKNLTHVVIDNNAYASCSEEKSCSDKANFPFVAALQGYPLIYIVNTSAELNKAVKESFSKPGPSFIHAKIGLGGRRDFKRPLDLPYIAERFKQYFKE